MVALDDLAQDRRDVLVVVRAVDATDEQAARFVRIARGIHGKPIRMRLVEFRVRAIRVHAGKHDEPIIVRGAAELAE